MTTVLDDIARRIARCQCAECRRFEAQQDDFLISAIVKPSVVPPAVQWSPYDKKEDDRG